MAWKPRLLLPEEVRSVCSHFYSSNEAAAEATAGVRLPFPSSVTLSKLLDLSEPQFACPLSEDKSSPYLKSDDDESNEKITQCLQHGECLLCVNFIFILCCCL